ncbi:DUF6962 family protein [Ketobacter sp.]|uniref:DUF6962 family protein n=1 Tax=Ketobacter sp. TaxID=2083498 RepID=UPI000F25AD87|nr:hypothetical protein [Ketobacter sp.]RLT98085.1 MAG: hypothetical protein D9N14_10695 [Ketobacter sp.]
MLISLNYAIFALALCLSLDLFRRPSRFREAATHMALFAVAALLGGFAHHMEAEQSAVNQVIAGLNQWLPDHSRVGSFHNVYLRVWLATFFAIGLTEYYFMRIFLHPLADRYGFRWVKSGLVASLLLFCAASLLISQYSLVVVFHLFTHLLVIGFSLYLIFAQGLRLFWQLIALVTLNLVAGGVWSLMALGSLPTGPLHYNDWYHLIILVFLVYLHWVLTRGGLVDALHSLSPAPGSRLQLQAQRPQAIELHGG